MRAVVLALVVCCAACQPFRPTPPPTPPVPATYTSLGGTWQPPHAWWQAWDAPELHGLIQRALAEGFDVRLAQSRLAQAQAAARKATAATLPTISGELSPERRLSGGTGLPTVESTLWGLTGAASYEVDLWGKVAAHTAVAQLAVLQREEALRTAAMTVSAEVATAWVDLVSTTLQLQVAQRQLREHERLLASITQRYQEGAASVLDLETQRKALAEARAILPTLEATQAARRAQLAVLCALPGPGDVPIPHASLPQPWPIPQTGIPAALLDERPDIRLKAAAAYSAGFDLAAAQADRLPTLTLFGRLTASGPNMGGILDTWLTRLLASLAGPIVDGGARRAEVDRAAAAQEEAILDYARTVAQAVAEADSALAEVLAAQKTLETTTARLEAAQRVVAATQDRYRAGTLEYPDLAQTLLQMHTLERTLIQHHATLLARHVALVRALGKGWQTLAPRNAS